MKKGIFLVFLFLTQMASATHIVGGELTYKYFSKNSKGDVTYSVRLVLFFDCNKDGGLNSIPTDYTVLLNVFDAKSGALLPNLCMATTYIERSEISANTYKCIKNTPNLCVIKYVYQTIMVLPKRANGYILSFERCCRNKTIENIYDPGATGATYWTEIKPESTIGKNSSPVFKSLPPVFLCLNAPFTFDHSATDEDGDSLAYEFTTPYYGATVSNPRPNFGSPGNYPTFPLKGNRLVNWVSPYYADNAMDGNPILEVDEKTGRLTVTPTKSGQFVMGIKVKEYRNGVLIGETRREYQFNVANCTFSVVSVFSPTDSLTNKVSKVFCKDLPIKFKNYSSGAVRYHWDFGIAGINSDTSNQFSPCYRYSKSGNYKITLIAYNTICIDTFDYIITIKDNFKVNLGNDTIFCQAATLKLDPGIIGKQYLWNTNETSQSITVNQTGVYIVTVTDAPCYAKDTISVIIDRSIFNAGRDSVQCNYGFVPFAYSTAGSYKSYLWNDGTTSNTVFIPKVGKYWVTIKNINGCMRTDTIEAFQFEPPQSFLRDTAVCIGYNGTFDVKIDGYVYLWNTGETTRQIVTSLSGKHWVNIANGLCKSSDTATLFNINPGLEIGRDTSFCGPFNFAIKTNKPFVTYSWSNGGTSRETSINAPGEVKVRIMNSDGCFQTDSLIIINYPENISSIAGDTNACTSSILNLVASNNASYLWSTGETSKNILTQEGGVLWVITIDSNKCMDTVYHQITRDPNAFPNDIYMPNVFTPSGDELNEFYPDHKFHDVYAPYHLVIFNRWGEKLFETESPGKYWDGTTKDKPSQAGMYIYSLNYIGCDNQKHVINGEFNLLR